MKGHTTGPWRGAGTPGCEIIGNSRIVATMTWCSGFQEEDMANALLVTAAPEMLAALRWARADIDAAITVTEQKFQQPALGLRQTLAKLDEVIARATTPSQTAMERS